MRRTRRRLSAFIGALTLALVVTGCGVPTSGGPKALSQDVVPGRQSQSTPTTAPPDDLPVTIILLDLANGNAPTPVLRATPPQSDRLSTVLQFLLVGPLGTDSAQGLFSAIPPSTRLISVSPNVTASSHTPLAGPLTVNLSAEFTRATGESAVLAVAQVVYTISCALTPTTGAARVLFEVDGVPQQVPLGNGTPAAGPVSALLYDNGALPSCTPTP